MSRLRAEYPDYEVIAPTCQDADAPSITHFVHILNVPTEDLTAVVDRAWDIAFEFYGAEPIPFLLTSINPESSAKHFADDLAAIDLPAIDFGAFDFGAIDFGAFDLPAFDFDAIDFGAFDFDAIDFDAGDRLLDTEMTILYPSTALVGFLVEHEVVSCEPDVFMAGYALAA